MLDLFSWCANMSAPFVSHARNFLWDCGAAAGWLRVNPSAACAVCADPPSPSSLSTPLPHPPAEMEELQSSAAPAKPPYLGRNLPAFLWLPKSQLLNDCCSGASSLRFPLRENLYVKPRGMFCFALLFLKLSSPSLLLPPSPPSSSTFICLIKKHTSIC